MGHSHEGVSGDVMAITEKLGKAASWPSAGRAALLVSAPIARPAGAIVGACDAGARWSSQPSGPRCLTCAAVGALVTAWSTALVSELEGARADRVGLASGVAQRKTQKD